MVMGLTAISDLHIHDEKDPLYSSLIHLIEALKSPRDVLVLGGDIFDVLIGSKEIYLNRYRVFLEATRSAQERGAQIHYIEGNHDFLIHQEFARRGKFTVHSRSLSLDHEGRRFFFSHGDLVDRGDIAYRALRLYFRSPVNRGLVKALPGEWVDAIGRKMSRKSRCGRGGCAATLPAGQMEKLRKLYRSFAADQIARGFDYVVLGHCHDLDEMAFQVGERRGQYINAGYPRVHGSYLSWHPGDEKIQRERLSG